MSRFKKESQVWAFLAEAYEHGHSTEVSMHSGLCLALQSLWLHLGDGLRQQCEKRLRNRFKPRQPRWWQVWKKPHNSPYYWPAGERAPRAEACNVLFYEASAEERAAHWSETKP